MKILKIDRFSFFFAKNYPKFCEQNVVCNTLDSPSYFAAERGSTLGADFCEYD